MKSKQEERRKIGKAKEQRLNQIIVSELKKSKQKQKQKQTNKQTYKIKTTSQPGVPGPPTNL